MDEASVQRISEDGISVLRVTTATEDGGRAYIEIGVVSSAVLRRKLPDRNTKRGGRPLIEARASDNHGERTVVLHHPDLGEVRIVLDRAAAEDLAQQLIPRTRRKR